MLLSNHNVIFLPTQKNTLIGIRSMATYHDMHCWRSLDMIGIGLVTQEFVGYSGAGIVRYLWATASAVKRLAHTKGLLGPSRYSYPALELRSLFIVFPGG